MQFHHLANGDLDHQTTFVLPVQGQNIRLSSIFVYQHITDSDLQTNKTKGILSKQYTVLKCNLLKKKSPQIKLHMQLGHLQPAATTAITCFRSLEIVLSHLCREILLTLHYKTVLIQAHWRVFALFNPCLLSYTILFRDNGL